MLGIKTEKTEKGVARYRIEYFDQQGGRHRPKFKSEAEAKAELIRRTGAILDNTYIDPKRVPTFEALCQSWVADKIEQSRTPGRGYRPSTLSSWQIHSDHLIAVFGMRKVNEISAQIIEHAIAKWQEPKASGGRGLSPHTVSKLLTTATRIFKLGIKSKFLTCDPVSLVERVKADSGEQSEAGERLRDDGEVTPDKVLTPEETKRVILAAKPGLYRAIITTAIFTGARHGELLALRWSNVNFGDKVVEIGRSLSTAHVRGEANQPKIRWFDTKTKSGLREIPMSAELASTLKAWKEKCPKSNLDLVFPTALGKPCYAANILRTGLYPALKQAGIDKRITMHGLRHTYASMLFALGRPSITVSQYLGHANVSITETVYVHFLKPKKQDTMADLEKLIQNG